MYEELVSLIHASTINEFPELKNEVELLAAITHWLHLPNTHFRFREALLISLWDKTVTDYCVDNNTSLRQLKEQVRFTSQNEDFTFVDLFAGIGGFQLALQANGGKCLFSSEWDKSAKTTYYKNHGKYPFGDINQFTGLEVSDGSLDKLIPDHTILAGGFPCQPFSHAGVSARSSLGLAHGFECETQGTLFHSIARIAFVKQPEVVFMENVKNIVSHNDGETFKVIRHTMENLAEKQLGKHNYIFHYAIINSQTIVAQRRVRCFMVCIREDVFNKAGRKPFIFPEFKGEAIPLRQALENLTPAEIDEYTISDRLWQGHIARTERNLERNTGFTAHVADLDRPSNTIVARYGKDGKECLVPQKDKNPRKLTRRECAKLFGYPPNFWMPPAKTPTYKQFGNSVVVPVVQAIALNITQYLGLPREEHEIKDLFD